MLKYFQRVSEQNKLAANIIDYPKINYLLLIFKNKNASRISFSSYKFF